MTLKPLEIRGLSKAFGTVHALHGVSFAIEPGEVFGYLGPNGAGKTTTLRIVLGLVRQSSGTVSVFGLPAGEWASRNDVGFMPGDLHLYSDMTGASALDYFARFRPGRPTVLRPMLLDAFALDASTLIRRIKFLSHGTRQKLGLVIAMQQDPALLLLDEPSNGLDPLMQRAFRDIVSELALRGRAVLLSSHVLSEAEDVCHRVAILRQGELVALETMQSLRSNVVRRLLVRFRSDVPRPVLESPGVTRSQVNGREAALWVRGDLNGILRAIAQTEVDDLAFPEPELEDIFLSYYATPDPHA